MIKVSEPTESSESPPSFSTMEQVRDAIFELHEWDHSDGRDYKQLPIPTTAQKVIQDNIAILSQAENAQTDKNIPKDEIRTAIDFLQNRLDGFEFRATHHLPGVLRQKHDVRQLLFDNHMEDAALFMGLLQQQPDVGADDIEQLRHEYQIIMDLKEEGVNPDISDLKRQIYAIIPGISAQECSTQLFTLYKLEKQLKSVASLVQSQNDAFSSRQLKDARDHISVVRSNIIKSVADDLQMRRSHYIINIIHREARKVMESDESLNGLTPEELLNHQIHELYAVLELSEPIPETEEQWREMQIQLSVSFIGAETEEAALLAENDRYIEDRITFIEHLSKRKRMQSIQKRLDELHDTEKRLSGAIRVFEFLVPGVIFSDTVQKMNQSS
jgi:hypothetical protein